MYAKRPLKRFQVTLPTKHGDRVKRLAQHLRDGDTVATALAKVWPKNVARAAKRIEAS